VISTDQLSITQSSPQLLISLFTHVHRLVYTDLTIYSQHPFHTTLSGHILAGQSLPSFDNILRVLCLGVSVR